MAPLPTVDPAVESAAEPLAEAVAPGWQDAPRSLAAGALLRQACGATSPVRGRLTEAEVLVAFDFGVGPAGTIGAANRQLASVADSLAPLPVLAQSETARALAERGRIVVDVEALARAREGVGPEAYVCTTMVARAAAAVVADAGWSTVGIVAHPAHAGRCAAACEAFGLRSVVPAAVLRVDFDRASRQWWTRRRAAWVARELAVIAQQVAAGNLPLR